MNVGSSRFHAKALLVSHAIVTFLASGWLKVQQSGGVMLCCRDFRLSRHKSKVIDEGFGDLGAERERQSVIMVADSRRG